VAVVVGKELLQDEMLVVADPLEQSLSASSASWVGVGSVLPYRPSRKTRQNVELFLFPIRFRG